MIGDQRHNVLTGVILVLVLAAALGHAQQNGSSPSVHADFTAALQAHVKDGWVDYGALKRDSRFRHYLDKIAAIHPDTLAGDNARLAFWINAYNAYTIKLIIDHMPLQSIRDIGLGLPILFGPWSKKIANIGGEMYTLNAIEHDIIREQFNEPRIHFALVCAARSCPKLRPEAYEANRLNEQLEEETRRFLTDPDRNRVDREKKTLFLSKILDWYESDFEKNGGSVKVFVAKYLSAGDRSFVLQKDTDVEYFDYDWSLNGR